MAGHDSGTAVAAGEHGRARVEAQLALVLVAAVAAPAVVGEDGADFLLEELRRRRGQRRVSGRRLPGPAPGQQTAQDDKTGRGCVDAECQPASHVAPSGCLAANMECLAIVTESDREGAKFSRGLWRALSSLALAKARG